MLTLNTLSLSLLNTDLTVIFLHRTLKDAKQKEFWSKPSSEELLVFVLKFLDSKHNENKRKVERKHLRIFSSYENVRENNERASYFLNERGCRLFNKVQEDAEQMSEKNSAEIKAGEGIMETSKNGDKKLYLTDETSCDCSFFLNNQFYCKHILLLRKLENLSPINALSINKRWLRTEVELDHDPGNEEVNVDVIQTNCESTMIEPQANENLNPDGPKQTEENIVELTVSSTQSSLNPRTELQGSDKDEYFNISANVVNFDSMEVLVADYLETSEVEDIQENLVISTQLCSKVPEYNDPNVSFPQAPGILSRTCDLSAKASLVSFEVSSPSALASAPTVGIKSTTSSMSGNPIDVSPKCVSSPNLASHPNADKIPKGSYIKPIDDVSKQVPFCTAPFSTNRAVSNLNPDSSHLEFPSQVELKDSPNLAPVTVAGIVTSNFTQVNLYQASSKDPKFHADSSNSKSECGKISSPAIPSQEPPVCFAVKETATYSEEKSLRSVCFKDSVSTKPTSISSSTPSQSSISCSMFSTAAILPDSLAVQKSLISSFSNKFCGNSSLDHSYSLPESSVDSSTTCSLGDSRSSSLNSVNLATTSRLNSFAEGSCKAFSTMAVSSPKVDQSRTAVSRSKLMRNGSMLRSLTPLSPTPNSNLWSNSSNVKTFNGGSKKCTATSSHSAPIVEVSNRVFPNVEEPGSSKSKDPICVGSLHASNKEIASNTPVIEHFNYDSRPSSKQINDKSTCQDKILVKFQENLKRSGRPRKKKERLSFNVKRKDGNNNCQKVAEKSKLKKTKRKAVELINSPLHVVEDLEIDRAVNELISVPSPVTDQVGGKRKRKKCGSYSTAKKKSMRTKVDDLLTKCSESEEDDSFHETFQNIKKMKEQHEKEMERVDFEIDEIVKSSEVNKQVREVNAKMGEQIRLELSEPTIRRNMKKNLSHLSKVKAGEIPSSRHIQFMTVKSRQQLFYRQLSNPFTDKH